MKKPSWKSTFLKYLLGLAVLAYVVWSNWEPKPGASGQGLKEIFRNPIHFGPWIIAGLFTVSATILTFIRWSILTRALDLPLSFRETIRLGCLGYFFNTMLPGSIGGDLVKAGALIRSQERRSAAVATIFCDRLIGLVGLIALVVITGSIFWCMDDPIFHKPGLAWVFRSCSIILIAGAVVWIFMGFLNSHQAHRLAGRLALVPKVGGALSEVWRSVWVYRSKAGVVYLTLLMTVGLHVLNVFGFHYAVRVFTSDPAQWASLREHFIIVPVGFVVRAIPLTPGGAGVAEAGFGGLYELAQHPRTTGIAASVALLVLAWVFGAIAYVIGILIPPEKKPADAP